LLGGEVEVDGLLNLDDFADETGVTLPEGPYETVAGYVIAALGKLPARGDWVEVSGHRLAVTELDGRRIARIRVAPAGAAGAGAGAAGSGGGPGPDGAGAGPVDGAEPGGPEPPDRLTTG
jgi:putative hemolysin